MIEYKLSSEISWILQFPCLHNAKERKLQYLQKLFKGFSIPPFSAYAKFSENLTFLTHKSADAHTNPCISGSKKCQFFGKFVFQRLENTPLLLGLFIISTKEKERNRSNVYRVYSKPYQTCKEELFAKIFNDWKPLYISKKKSAKISILDVRQGFK